MPLSLETEAHFRGVFVQQYALADPLGSEPQRSFSSAHSAPDFRDKTARSTRTIRSSIFAG
jgi:hypothetical protein